MHLIPPLFTLHSPDWSKKYRNTNASYIPPSEAKINFVPPVACAVCGHRVHLSLHRVVRRRGQHRHFGFGLLNLSFIFDILPCNSGEVGYGRVTRDASLVCAWRGALYWLPLALSLALGCVAQCCIAAPHHFWYLRAQGQYAWYAGRPRMPKYI